MMSLQGLSAERRMARISVLSTEASTLLESLSQPEDVDIVNMVDEVEKQYTGWRLSVSGQRLSWMKRISGRILRHEQREL